MGTKGEYRAEKVRRQLSDKVDSGGVPDKDAEYIRELADFESGQKAPNTVANHVRYLGLTSRRMDTPLTEASLSDVIDVLTAMKGGTHPEVKDSGIIVRNYVSALRVFYRHFDELGVPAEDIDIDEDYNGRELSPDDLLYEDEVDALLSAARRANPRDMAFIAMALATGQRLDALRTLRLKHVTEDGPTMSIQLNDDEADLKGASGRVPLLWAKHYVRPWIESHPQKDNPEAALFPPNADKNLSETDGETAEPIAGASIRHMVSQRASEAGIEKDVYPHLLRHCCITRMAADGQLSEQQIKQTVGWAADSSQFATYVNLADELHNDSMRESLGLPTSNTGTPNVGRPPLERCANCGGKLREDQQRCPTCQTPLTHSEAEHGSPDSQSPAEMVKDMSDQEKLEVLDALRDELTD